MDTKENKLSVPNFSDKDTDSSFLWKLWLDAMHTTENFLEIVEGTEEGSIERIDN